MLKAASRQFHSDSQRNWVKKSTSQKPTKQLREDLEKNNANINCELSFNSYN